MPKEKSFMDTGALVKLLLPLIAMVVSYSLQHLNFSATVNTSIAGATVILATALGLFLQGKLTGNVYGDAMLIASTSIALQSEAFAALQKYLLTNFALFGLKRPVNPVQPNSNSNETH
ncbi:MAG TPA: hypothetical protein VL443_08265 [Cyclobacteriaceae bacterium]|jgi:hypothetical protein|nr:hypothetical protein [Cyclobacteriaceae bacterium]